MAKPILQNISTFDAAKNKTIAFQWHGSNLSKCKISIYAVDTDILAYEDEFEIIGHNYSFILPANSIDNDINYYANLVTYDIHDNVSTESNTVSFKCEISPDFEIDMENNITLNTSAIEVSIIFEHHTDSLKTLIFYLMDNQNNILVQSKEILYENNEDLHYRFIGVENNTTYKVYATCTTTYGLEIETSAKTVHIKCDSPSFGGECYVEVNNNVGYTKLSTYFIVVQYNGDKVFDFADSMIDLRNNNMYYDEGFEISGDFKICLKAKGVPTNHQLLMLGSSEGDIILDWNYYDDSIVNDYKFRLLTKQGNLRGVIYSSSINLTDDTIIEIWITRENHIYDLEVKEIASTS